MYDETIDVVNSREVASPAGSDQSVEVAPALRPRAAMSGKFNPPARHVTSSAGAFDSDSDSQSDDEKLTAETLIRDKRYSARMSSKLAQDIKRQVSNEEMTKKNEPNKNKIVDSSENSDSDSNENGEMALRRGEEGGAARRAGRGGAVPPGAYDPKKFADLKVSPELDNLFQHILRYTPQKIDIEYRLQPFIPDYVPAVGDIDAFIKVTTPRRMVGGASVPNELRDKIEDLGLTVLDEPAAQQSDSALLHLQLRAISKTNFAKSTVVTKKIDNAEKNSKAIEQWIRDVSELHLSKPAPTVSYTRKMPDIESLMEEWPESMEETLNNVGFPPATIDCSLVEYVDLMCSLFDIPVAEDTLNARIQALHVLFSLYNAVKSSQLYADRQKENSGLETN